MQNSATVEEQRQQKSINKHDLLIRVDAMMEFKHIGKEKIFP